MTRIDTLNYRLSSLPIETQFKFVMETIAHLAPQVSAVADYVSVVSTDDDAAALALADWPMREGGDPARWAGPDHLAAFEPGGYGGIGLREGEVAARVSAGVELYGKPSAPDILQRAAQHMQDRAASRDQAGGERSMRRTVDAFNALTGHNVSERDGWLFMAVLKMARATTTPTGTPDDYEDLAAYAALAGESAQEKQP